MICLAILDSPWFYVARHLSVDCRMSTFLGGGFFLYEQNRCVNPLVPLFTIKNGFLSTTNSYSSASSGHRTAFLQRSGLHGPDGPAAVIGVCSHVWRETNALPTPASKPTMKDHFGGPIDRGNGWQENEKFSNEQKIRQSPLSPDALKSILPRDDKKGLRPRPQPFPSLPQVCSGG